MGLANGRTVQWEGVVDRRGQQHSLRGYSDILLASKLPPDPSYSCLLKSEQCSCWSRDLKNLFSEALLLQWMLRSTLEEISSCALISSGMFPCSFQEVGSSQIKEVFVLKIL